MEMDYNGLQCESISQFGIYIPRSKRAACRQWVPERREILQLLLEEIFSHVFPVFRLSGETRTTETENDSKWNEEREATPIL
jgi:hypothetical protein